MTNQILRAIDGGVWKYSMAQMNPYVLEELRWDVESYTEAWLGSRIPLPEFGLWIAQNGN